MICPTNNDIVQKFTGEFAKQIAEKQERLAEELIRKGIDPRRVNVMQRVWYDDDSCIIHCDLIPMIDGVFYDLLKEEKG